MEQDQPTSTLLEETELIAQRFLARRGRLTNRATEVKLIDFRDYRPGDELRNVDWKAAARLQRSFVRVFEQQRALVCYYVVDSGAPMGERFDDRFTRLEYARRLVGAMTAMALGQGDEVSLAIFDRGLRTLLPPAKMRGARYAILDVLEKTEPDGPRDVETAIRRVCGSLPRRGFAVLMSPFDGPPLPIVRAMDILRRRRFEVLLVQILDEKAVKDPQLTSSRPRPRGALRAEKAQSLFEAAEWRDVPCVVADPRAECTDVLEAYMNQRTAITWAPLRSPRIAYEAVDEEEEQEGEDELQNEAGGH